MSNSPPRALLLIGSAKTAHTSNSESLGRHMLDLLRERGFETDTVFLYRAQSTPKDTAALLSAVDATDVIVLAFPVYTDCLPYLVIKTLEQIAEHRQATEPPRKQRLLAITNCGFPEVEHTATALAICRQFAHETGIEWAGGLGLGSGEVIGGKPLAQIGGMVRNVTKSLQLAADAIAEGKPVPQESVDLMAKPLIPKWMFMMMGSAGWNKRAKKFGSQDKLYDRPFEKPSA